MISNLSTGEANGNGSNPVMFEVMERPSERKRME
jgi:hypothetical protein